MLFYSPDTITIYLPRQKAARFGFTISPAAKKNATPASINRLEPAIILSYSKTLGLFVTRSRPYRGIALEKGNGERKKQDYSTYRAVSPFSLYQRAHHIYKFIKGWRIAILLRLFLNNRFRRAHIDTCPAFSAYVFVDNIGCFAFFYRLGWAFTGACSAHGAIIGNFIRHNILQKIFHTITHRAIVNSKKVSSQQPDDYDNRRKYKYSRDNADYHTVFRLIKSFLYNGIAHLDPDILLFLRFP